MLLLNRHEVESLLPMEAALAAVEEGFRRLALGQVVMPQRAAVEITPHNGLHLSMPAYVAGQNKSSAYVAGAEAGAPDASSRATEARSANVPDALTIKIVTVYGDNPARHGLPTIQGLLLVHDAATGAPLALMDAEALTAIRTGAASGVATKHMARPDAQVLTIFGAGGQAAAQVEAVCAVRPIRQVYVVTRTRLREESFCARLAQKLQIPVQPAQALLGSSARNPSFSSTPAPPAASAVWAAVEAADVLCTATNSATPLFAANWVQPGAHINAIGAYTRTLREVDAATVRRSRVIVDQHQAARAEAGDILLAIEEGAIAYEHVAGELGQVVSGALPGRGHAQEITLFKSVGLAMQDAVTATYVVEQARAHGMGVEISL